MTLNLQTGLLKIRMAKILTFMYSLSWKLWYQFIDEDIRGSTEVQIDAKLGMK